MSCVSGVVVGCGRRVEGRGSVPVILVYKPQSQAIAKSSHFQEAQLSHPSFGLMSRNLCMSCLGCTVAVVVRDILKGQ